MKVLEEGEASEFERTKESQTATKYGQTRAPTSAKTTMNRLQLLERCAQIAERLLGTAAPSSGRQNIHIVPSCSIPSLALPRWSPVASLLEEMGFSTQLSKRLSHAYMEAGHKLALAFDQQYQAIASQLQTQTSHIACHNGTCTGLQRLQASVSTLFASHAKGYLDILLSKLRSSTAQERPKRGATPKVRAGVGEHRQMSAQVSHRT